MAEVTKGKVFSPSQTSVFLECEMRWFLRYRQRYEGKFYMQKEIAGCVGSAFHTYFEFEEEGHKVALERAVHDFHERMGKLKEVRQCSERASAYEAAAPERLKKLIDLYVRKNPIPASWEIFDRERVFPDHGFSRIDAMYRTSMGVLGPLDFKTRGRLQANQVDKARREFGTSGQLMHYCWMASEVYGETVNQASIVLITLEPRAFIEIWQYRFREKTLEIWLAGRREAWADMERIIAGERTPVMADVHENKYGICESHDICFKHGFEESLIDQHFIVLQ